MRHDISSTVGATAGVTAEVAQDPTVGLSHSNSSQPSLSEESPCCTMCGMDIVCVECGEDRAPGFVLEAEAEPEPADPQEEEYEDYESDEDMEEDAS
jgi:DNA-directed RNA polymerase II subunit RPB9